jgi:hypothetical protein
MATSGSTLAARRAGTAHAPSPTPTMTRVTSSMVYGSFGVTPNRSPSRRRAVANDATRPSPTPRRAGVPRRRAPCGAPGAAPPRGSCGCRFRWCAAPRRTRARPRCRRRRPPAPGGRSPHEVGVEALRRHRLLADLLEGGDPLDRVVRSHLPHDALGFRGDGRRVRPRTTNAPGSSRARSGKAGGTLRAGRGRPGRGRSCC